MASAEVLRRLLEEFAEKQALVREEIQVVQDEVRQLEERMGSCRRRLATIGADRDKVLSMRRRYLEKKFDVIAAGRPVELEQPLPVPQWSAQPAVESSKVQATPKAAASPLPPASAGDDPKMGQQAGPVPVEAAQAYPLSDNPAQSAAPAMNPLQELRKRFGISSILGSRKTAEVEQASAAPPPPWSEGTAEPIAPSVEREELLAPQPHANNPPFAGSDASDQSPGNMPSASASKVPHSDPQAQPKPGVDSIVDLGSEQHEGDEKDDTLKRINETLRGLFR